VGALSTGVLLSLWHSGALGRCGLHLGALDPPCWSGSVLSLLEVPSPQLSLD